MALPATAENSPRAKETRDSTFIVVESGGDKMEEEWKSRQREYAAEYPSICTREVQERDKRAGWSVRVVHPHL